EQPDIPGLELDIYPNPFFQQVTFEVSGISVSELNLEVFDAQGRLLRRETDYTNRLVMDRKNLSSGTYFFRLESQGQLLGSGTIVVQ
ncbi:MAG TPA: T9SS type A sorting domain-containing protein, partial [Bacteroidales bacterium]|nr:T9SS type A sorting domain-containing protein [Bacteroidales bacterium]